MKVRVLEVTQHSEETSIVRFESAAGTALARWASAALEPRVGEEYSAELDFRVVLSEDARTIESDANAFEELEGLVRVSGRVESVDADGMLYLRVSRDCLLMIESNGGISPRDAVRFTCSPSEIDLYANR